MVESLVETKRKLETTLGLLDHIIDRTSTPFTKRARLHAASPRRDAKALKSLVDEVDAELSDPEAWKAGRKRRRRDAQAAAAAITQPNTSLYRPWSREDFFQRLSTYTPLSWTETSFLSPPVAARYGWQCRSTTENGKNVDGSAREYSPHNQLECTFCHAWLAISTSVEGLDKERENELKTYYEGELVESHETECPWRTKPCHGSIYRLPVEPPRITLRSLAIRQSKLAELADELPTIADSPLDADGLQTLLSCLAHFPSEIETIPTSSELSDLKDNDRKALLLASFGWQRLDIEDRHVLECPMCLRQVGCWSFHPSTSTDEEILKELEPTFDIIHQHRSYCPWIADGTEIAPSSLPNWANPALSGWRRLLAAARAVNQPTSFNAEQLKHLQHTANTILRESSRRPLYRLRR